MKRSSSQRPMLAKVRVWRNSRFGNQVSRVQMQIGGLGAVIRSLGPVRSATVIRHLNPGQSPTPLSNRILERGVLSPGRQTWQAHASSMAAAPVRPERKFCELQLDLRRSNDYPFKERPQELCQHRVEVVLNGCGVQSQDPAKAKV